MNILRPRSCRGLAPVAAALCLGLCAGWGGCRSPQIAITLPSAPGPITPVATAPGLPLALTRQLNKFVDDAIGAFAAHRADIMGGNAEFGEFELNTQYESTRIHQKFTPIEAHFNAGEELFEFHFGRQQGFGDAMGGRPPNVHRVHRGGHGGPDTTSCKSCHHRGGDDGAGEYTENALTGGDGESTYHAHERNPPAVLGSGAIQVLAAEITAALNKQVQPPAGPLDFDYPVRLTYQGVDFGEVTVGRKGRVDASRLRAIDPDLVVRPFGWKGTHSTLRRFAEEAFQVHHGMQSDALVAMRRRFGPLPFGASPATLALLANLGDGPPQDPDKDGIFSELNADFLTSIATYLTLLPLPIIDPPRSPDLAAAFRDGENAFRQVGCAECHKPYWLIKDPVWHEHGEGDPISQDLVMDLRKDIQRGPQLDTTDTLHDGAYPIFIYSDLRRHDMGPGLADEYEAEGAVHKGDHVGPEIPPTYFLTRPLWGLADSAPYLHDGRAITIPDAIVAHGGEARAAREAYLKLPPERQRAMHVFLLSLARPPVPEVVP